MPDLALVTGAPGWAGSRLVRILTDHGPPPARNGRVTDRYAHVRCLIAPGVDARELADVETIEGDIRDSAAVARFMQGADGADLFHFAGLIHPRLRVRDLAEVNDLGARVLLAHAIPAGVRRVIALSSNSPVGVSRDPAALFDEQTPARPYLAYGASKLAMENSLRAAAVQSVILRACWFYGPGQPARQNRFYRMVRDGGAPLLAGGRARRSVSYVDGIAQAALLAAATPEAAGQTYWTADARPYPLSEIVETIATVLREDFGVRVKGSGRALPGLVGDIAQAADALIQRLGFYNQQLHVLGEMNKTIACSVARARRELGWEPGPGLREGTRRSIQWALDHGEVF